MANKDDLSLYVETIIEYFEPIIEGVEDIHSAKNIFASLGYNIPVDIKSFEKIKLAIDELFIVIDKIDQFIDDEEKQNLELFILTDLIKLLGKLFPLIANFGEDVKTIVAEADILVEPNILDDLGPRLIDYLTVQHIHKKFPATKQLLMFFGIIEEQFIDNTSSIFLKPHLRKIIHWNRIPELFSDPIGLLKLALTSQDVFLYHKLIFLVRELGVSLGLYSTYHIPNEEIFDIFNDVALDLSEFEGLEELETVRFPLISAVNSELFFEIYPILDSLTNRPTGIGIALEFGRELNIPIGDFWNLLIEMDADLSNGLGIIMKTPENINFVNNVFTNDLSNLEDNANFDVQFTVKKQEDILNSKLLSVGLSNGSRLEIESFESTFGIRKDNEVEFYAECDFIDCFFSIDVNEGDGFVSQTLSNKLEGAFHFGIGISNKKGIYFKSSGQLSTILPLQVDLGIVKIDNLFINIIPTEDSLIFNIGAGAKTYLGPLKIAIENVGFKSKFSFSGVNKFNVKSSLDFKPPNEIGIQIDTASVKGGGYLIFEPENGRYVGLAELTVVDKFTVKAIAIINTELPDGQEGYSFLLMITAEFKPIQLGFGFTLEGVGGLIGIHRSLNIDAIKEKVKSDAFDQVLFPEDPINNVHSIIASIDSIFPMQEGQYSFGIMGKIGWGAPKLIDIKAGLIFQVPRFKMAIIGTAKSEIVRTSKPKDGEEPTKIVLLRLQISFAAWFEPEKSLFGFDASLFNSEILGQKLTGDAALRLRGGDEPYFMLSVGGLHPEFEPPKGLGLGKLDRIEIAYKPESVDIDIAALFYAAVTSNTVQVGAELTAAYDGPGFRIEGTIGFDALFKFRPIYFNVAAWGSVTIHIFGSSWGLGIKGTIEGPYPYRFSLYVTLDLGWGGSYTKRIPTFTIGSEAKEERPTIDVLEELRLVIADDRSWSPILLGRTEILVSLRDRQKEFSNSGSDEDAEPELIVHPFGGIRIDQDRVPLEVTLERFGHNQPDGYNFFSLELKDEVTEGLTRFFAPAQFFEMDREEKLSRPSFEKMPSGIQTRDFKELQASSRILEKEVHYETQYYDPHSPWQSATERPKTQMKVEDFVVWRANASIARSPLGKKHKRATRSNALTFTTEKVAEDEFVIIHQEGTADFTEIKTKNEAAAQQKLKELIIDNPGLEDKLVVLPIYEIA